MPTPTPSRRAVARKNHGVLTRPLFDYNLPHCLRITIGTTGDNLRAAIAGDNTATAEILNRVEGRVAYKMGGDEESGPITITWKTSE